MIMAPQVSIKAFQIPQYTVKLLLTALPHTGSRQDPKLGSVQAGIGVIYAKQLL